MYISSGTLIHEISRSKVKTLERVFKLYSSIYLTVIYLILFSSAPLLLLVAHPVFISYILIGYAILVRIRLRTLRISWFIYLLVLIFLGGVIILIIYITSIAANEKFNFQKPLFFEGFFVARYIYIWRYYKTSIKLWKMNITIFYKIDIYSWRIKLIGD